jgi:predicted transcriptional regulator
MTTKYLVQLQVNSEELAEIMVDKREAVQNVQRMTQPVAVTNTPRKYQRTKTQKLRISHKFPRVVRAGMTKSEVALVNAIKSADLRVGNTFKRQSLNPVVAKHLQNLGLSPTGASPTVSDAIKRGWLNRVA